MEFWINSAETQIKDQGTGAERAGVLLVFASLTEPWGSLWKTTLSPLFYRDLEASQVTKNVILLQNFTYQKTIEVPKILGGTEEKNVTDTFEWYKELVFFTEDNPQFEGSLFTRFQEEVFEYYTKAGLQPEIRYE